MALHDAIVLFWPFRLALGKFPSASTTFSRLRVAGAFVVLCAVGATLRVGGGVIGRGGAKAKAPIQ
jgi:hypothetical protein